ncbi:phosphopentomutase [Clostridia bacterium]|nr:phosphopentomutase [Clostridia bacterium]
MPDANEYGDKGSNTLKACFLSGNLFIPNMQNLGLFNIDGIDFGDTALIPKAVFARMREISKGKDTTIGHWEIAGINVQNPLPVFPNGFPEKIIGEIERKTNKKVLCNRPYSGTKVLTDFGEKHLTTGDLIVYTSSDSVFQIAAHEKIIPINELYKFCEIARELLTDKYAVGRVIARPFVGEFPNFKRSPYRKDFSVNPPGKTMLDYLKENNFEVISIGKIYDIFNGQGITEKFKTTNNADGMKKTYEMLEKNFCGLCFTNLVDFDMLYGHRNDVVGYAKALSEFDVWLKTFIHDLKENDILIITADHGCDPSTASTNHSREYTPMIIFGKKIKSGINLGTRDTFSDISATILEYFSIPNFLNGKSFFKEVSKL